MNPFSRKLLILVLFGIALSLLTGTLVLRQSWLIEQWYLHRLKDDDPQRQWEAARRLASMGTQAQREAGEWYAARVFDAKYDLWWKLITELNGVTKSIVEANCIAQLKAPNRDTRIRAGEVLGRMRSTRAVPDLLEALKKASAEDQLRSLVAASTFQSAVASAGKVAAPALIRALTGALTGENWGDYRFHALALGTIYEEHPALFRQNGLHGHVAIGDLVRFLAALMDDEAEGHAVRVAAREAVTAFSPETEPLNR